MKKKKNEDLVDPLKYCDYLKSFLKISLRGIFKDRRDVGRG